MSCNFTFTNSQLTIIFQLPFTKTVPVSGHVCEMTNGKLLVNDKCEMKNSSEGGYHG